MSANYSHTLDPQHPIPEDKDEVAPSMSHNEEEAEEVAERSRAHAEQVEAEAKARAEAAAAGEREPGSPGRPDEVSEPGVSPDAPGEGKDAQEGGTDDQGDDSPCPTDGTVQDVLDWVGDDKARAQVALDAEQSGQQRTTLISELERRTESTA